MRSLSLGIDHKSLCNYLFINFYINVRSDSIRYSGELVREFVVHLTVSYLYLHGYMVHMTPITLRL